MKSNNNEIILKMFFKLYNYTAVQSKKVSNYIMKNTDIINKIYQ